MKYNRMYPYEAKKEVAPNLRVEEENSVYIL